MAGRKPTEEEIERMLDEHARRRYPEASAIRRIGGPRTRKVSLPDALVTVTADEGGNISEAVTRRALKKRPGRGGKAAPGARKPAAAGKPAPGKAAGRPAAKKAPAGGAGKKPPAGGRAEGGAEAPRRRRAAFREGDEVENVYSGGRYRVLESDGPTACVTDGTAGFYRMASSDLAPAKKGRR